jgi:hypothetical protein
MSLSALHYTGSIPYSSYLEPVCVFGEEGGGFVENEVEFYFGGMGYGVGWMVNT